MVRSDTPLRLTGRIRTHRADIAMRAAASKSACPRETERAHALIHVVNILDTWARERADWHCMVRAPRPGTDQTAGDVPRHAAGGFGPGMNDSLRARGIERRVYWTRCEANVMSQAPALARAPKCSPQRVGHVRGAGLSFRRSVSFTVASVRSVCGLPCIRTYVIGDRMAAQVADSETMLARAAARFARRNTGFSQARSRVMSRSATLTELYRLRARSSHTAPLARRFRASFKLEQLTRHSIHTSVQPYLGGTDLCRFLTKA
jgi:hypothetical protein